MSTPSTSTFSGSPAHPAATRVPPACSGRSTRGPPSSRQVLGQGSRSSPGTGWVGLASPPARSVAAGDAGWTGTALSGWRRIGVGRRARCADGCARFRGRPCDAGCPGRRPGCWSWRPPAWWAASRLSAGGGVRGQGGAELAAATISLSLSRVHRLRTPAPPPRSRAVWDGRHPLQPPLRRPGASAPVMAGEAPAVRRAP